MRRKNVKCTLDHQLIDAKIEVIEERISGHWTLDDQRWVGHGEAHKEFSRSLTEYKSSANEWRSTLADLRGNFLTKSEFEAKYSALRSELLGELKPMEATLGTVKEWQTARDARERGVTTTLSAQRTVLLVVGSVVGTVAALAGLIVLFSSLHPAVT